MCHVTFILFWSWGLWYHNCKLLLVFFHGVCCSELLTSYWCPDVADFYRSLFTGLETFNERLECYILPGLVKVWPQSCQPLLIYSFICCGVAKVCPYILNDYWYTGRYDGTLRTPFVNALINFTTVWNDFFILLFRLFIWITMSTSALFLVFC